MPSEGLIARRGSDPVRRLLLSVSVSVITLSLLFGLVAREGEVSPSLLIDALRQVAAPMVGLYLVSLLAQTWFRAARYRLLLRKGGEPRVPGMGHLYLVTMARNMLVDLFPARVGELGYVAMLNRGYRVSTEGGLSSLSISVLFDFLALGLVIVALVLPPLLARAPGVPMLGAALLLAVVIGLGWWALFHGLPWFLRWRVPRRIAGRWRWSARGWGFLERLADTLDRTRHSGTFGAVLAYSAGVRLAKYAGLYALFLGVTRTLWPDIAALAPWAVLGTLIMAEGAAGLPMPAFMSFGAYEAGGTTALVLLGFAAADAALAMLAMHVVSQSLDYSLGGASFVAFAFLTRGAAPAPSTAAQVFAAAAEPKPARSALRAWIFPLFMAAVAFMLAAHTVRQARAVGALRPPDRGRASAAPAADRRAVDHLLGEDRGWMVWSSNRHGSHDILRMDLPGMRIRRLTDHAHTDTYPRICPQGRRIVFCRSQIPWVSQRDPVPWDLYLFDAETGEERLLTPNGYQPSWRNDGEAVIFVRAGTQIVEHRIADGAETVLLESGRDGIPEGIRFQTPSAHTARPEIAATLRGRRRAAALLVPGEGIRTVVSARGCQLYWAPDASFLYWADHGGRMNLSAYRAEPGGEAERWLDLPEPFSHQYFAHVSANGRFVVLGASTGGHEHDTADYEIFLWRVGTPEEAVARLTFHSGNDGWPDLFMVPRGQ